MRHTALMSTLSKRSFGDNGIPKLELGNEDA
jgi:hypothetical protein